MASREYRVQVEGLCMTFATATQPQASQESRTGVRVWVKHYTNTNKKPSDGSNKYPDLVEYFLSPHLNGLDHDQLHGGVVALDLDPGAQEIVNKTSGLGEWKTFDREAGGKREAAVKFLIRAVAQGTIPSYEVQSDGTEVALDRSNSKLREFRAMTAPVSVEDTSNDDEDTANNDEGTVNEDEDSEE